MSKAPTVPQTGGSFIRDPDGSLRPADVAPPAKSAPKAAVKTPVKEE